MAVLFVSPVPKGLTTKQKEIFQYMNRKEYLLYTTEGANYRCWLENPKGHKVDINRRTAESLAQKEIIKPDDSFDHNKQRGVFRWKLS